MAGELFFHTMKLLLASCFVLALGCEPSGVGLCESPFAEMHGIVSDLFGSPISMAKVEVVGQGHPSISTLTNNRGEYRIAGLEPGEKTVSVAFRGFFLLKEALVLKDGESRLLDFGLVVGNLSDLPPIPLRGRVVQNDDKPLEDATVTLVNAFNERVRFKRRTDPAGRFSMEVGEPGQYIVYASKAGYIVNVTSRHLPGTLPREKHEVSLKLSLLPHGLPGR